MIVRSTSPKRKSVNCVRTHRLTRLRFLMMHTLPENSDSIWKQPLKTENAKRFNTSPKRKRVSRTPLRLFTRLRFGLVLVQLQNLRFGLILVLISFMISDCGAQESVFSQREQDLVGGLRDRALFELAEAHCLNLLSRDGVTPTDFASIAIERIRVQTSKSRTGANREQQWQEVDRIAEEFFAAHPKNPRAVLVGLQQALAHLSFGKLLQQEVAAKSSTSNGREIGLKQLLAARTILNRTRQLRLDTVKVQANQNLSPHMLSSDQLRALGTSLDYQLAIVNLTSAELADTSSASENLNRIDALGRVLTQLTAVRAAVVNSKPLWWKTWIDEASCRRMLGEFSAADQILKTVRNDKRPKSTDGMLLQEEVALAIAIGDTQRMRSLADRAAKSRYDAETEIALIQLLVASGQIEKASRLANDVSASHGAYWSRRADVALLSGSGTGAAPVGNATIDSAETRMLLQAAENAEKNGDFEAAVRGFLSVADSQFSGGERADGLTSTVRAAMVLEKQKKHAEAASTLLKPATVYSSEQLSASIHLRGCWNLSKAKSDRFEEELSTHINQWSSSETANQARYWLASQQLNRKEYSSAFETLTNIGSQSTHFLGGIKLARFACRKQLSDTETKGVVTKPMANRMVQRWEDVYRGSGDAAKPSVAVAMTELGLAWSAESPVESAGRMRSVASFDSASSNTEFQYLLAIASGDIGEAKQLLARANAMPFDAAVVRQVLSLIDRLDDSTQLGQIKLAIAEDALSDSKDAKSKQMFNQSKASALVMLGRRKEALAIFQQLIAEEPKNLSAQLSLARISAAGDAIKLWRSIASRTASHSSPWFEAKYNVAKLLQASGENAEAAKMLKYIKAVAPGWENSALKADFEALLRISGG